MSDLVVTVFGVDRTGIVAALTGALADLGGNLEDSSMTILRGHLAMTLLVGVDADAAVVSATLAPVAARLGVDVSVAPVVRGASPTIEGGHWLLSVHGADRPGIVAAVTGLLAAAGGNITDLSTRLAGELYALICEVDLPAEADADALARDVTALGQRLGVHATLHRADADVF